MFKAVFKNIFERLLCVFAALFFLQIPLFMNFYQQQLIGHVDELQWQIKSMTEAAEKSEKSLDEFINKFVVDADPDFSSQGKIMETVHERWIKLTLALNALEGASLFTKPFVFFSYLQFDIFKSTLTTFKPGLPLTFEGFIYALIGVGFGFLIFQLFTIFWKKGKKDDHSVLERQ